MIEELNNQIKDRDDVIITTGVGQHQMFAAQFIEWKRPCTSIFLPARPPACPFVYLPSFSSGVFFYAIAER